MRYLLLLTFIIGNLLIGIFIHEFVHYIQYNEIEGKSIVFFKEDMPLAYVDTGDIIIYEKNNNKELVACLFGTGYWIVMLVYGFRNYEVFNNKPI